MRSKLGAAAVMAALSFVVTVVLGTAPAGARSTTSGISKVGTGSPVSGEFTPWSGGTEFSEFAGGDDEAGTDALAPQLGAESLARGAAPTDHGPSAKGTARVKSSPTFVNGFEGLNHYQQRYARGGNQFSVEPPDQALCVGNGYVLEAVNDVLNVFDTSGQSVLPDNTLSNVVAGFPRNVNHAVDLNSFYGYAPAINRTTGVRAEFVTDPSCLYDAATGRFFVTVLTLDTHANGSFTETNHIDVAVSQTSDPTAGWNVYRMDVTNDGTNIGGQNPGPYLGDYPHIGADANGFYVTTNAYPWCCNGFGGAQVYAISKAQLAAGAAHPTMVHIDTTGMVNAPSDAGSTQPGFTVWPATSPGTQFATGNGGTEYFLSSNAADEATHPVAGTGGDYTSSRLVLWTLTNTSSLDSGSPAVSLSTRLVDVNEYAIPPRQHQPGTGTPPGTNVPQGFCLNDETTSTIAGIGCYKLLVSTAVHNATKPEVVEPIDANDTRMQQVMYANGKLWGALDTAVSPDGGPTRAGIAWYVLNPASARVVNQGYLASTGYDLTYPAIGVTTSGRGVMAFTATGDGLYPSAGYAAIDATAGVSTWNVVAGGAGAAPDDGFSGYKAQRYPSGIRPRWGDYGAAAVDGSSVWLASEYIGQSCDYIPWGGPFFAGGSGDNLLGTCGGPSHGPGARTALANWSTYVSRFTP